MPGKRNATRNRATMPARRRARAALRCVVLCMAATLLVGACASPPPSRPEDVTDNRTVQKMLRDNECLKCHAVARDKTGPAWEDVAAKYRGRPDAEDRLVAHLTTAPIIDLDGNPETHRAITRMSQDQVRLLSRWLLGL